MPTDSITRREVIAGAAAAGAVLAASGADAQSRDLTSLTIVEAGRRIAARDLSSVELTRAYLERIERLNPRVNAYITVTAIRRSLRRGRSMPRLPRTAAAEGRCTASRSAQGQHRHGRVSVPRPRAPCTRTACRPRMRRSCTKLRDAGAVFLGKLNMHEFAYGGTCVDHALRPGPQSVESRLHAGRLVGRLGRGGCGAHVRGRARHRHRGVVRFPAACCGVVGLKATHGLASIRGIVPLSEMHDHVGPLARSVEDAALVMSRDRRFRPARSREHRAERSPVPAAHRARRRGAAYRYSAHAVLRGSRSRDRGGRARARSRCCAA